MNAGDPFFVVPSARSRGLLELQEMILANYAYRPLRFTRAPAEYITSQLYGNLDMVAQAEEVATRGLAKDPRNVSLLELRSEARGARHRFEDALADLELARTLAPPQRHADLDFAIANVHYQLGRYDDAVPLLLRRVVDRPSFSSQNRAAIVYLQTGNVEQARRHFAMAESMYKDTSPIPLSWLNVQRGLLEMHAGNYELAHTFFEEAWRRCPTYPMAKEHLAEIEGRLGHLDRSIALYGEVVSQTSNPEYIAALGEAWEKKGEPAKAAEMFRFAKNKNEQLLARHPDAMYWHAAAFYLGPGKDPAKALTLLTKNAKLRPTGNAWAALADAHLALGKPKEASVSIDKALASPLDLPELHWTAARVYKALGDQKISDEHKALALAANPKIADLEGDLDPPEDAPAANATP